MEPLLCWGPLLCSLRTMADFPSPVALCLLLLGAPLGAPALPACKEEEFLAGAVCCPKCRPGYRVKEACGEFTGTTCAPCTPGTYTAHLNGLRQCLPCQVCDPALGQVTRGNCSTTANTVCDWGCKRGHFCVREDGDACADCRPHRACRPGQRVRETGTQWQDTLCEDCPPGTFSAGGTQPACTPWTKCSGSFALEETPGTNSSDVTCSFQGSVIIMAIFILLFLFFLYLLLHRSSVVSRLRKAHEKRTFPRVLLSVPRPLALRLLARRRQDSGQERSSIGLCRPARSSPMSPRSRWRRQHSCSRRGARPLTGGTRMRTSEPAPRGCEQQPGPQGPDPRSGSRWDPLPEACPPRAEPGTTRVSPLDS